MKRMIAILLFIFSTVIASCQLEDDEEEVKECDMKCNVLLFSYFDYCDEYPSDNICESGNYPIILRICRNACGSDTAM